MSQFLTKFFKLNENKTNIKTEIIAGITIFLTMVYIVPLNGKIMADGQMPLEAVITATALITVIATIANGLWSNTPIAMSVGLGLNSMFVYALVLGGPKLPWQQVLGIVFFSGIIFLLLTITKIRKYIIKSISPDFKVAISAGIGAFIAFIGLKQIGIIAPDPVTFVKLGNLSDKTVLLGLAGIFIVFGLVVRKIKGAFIISILVTSVIGFFIGSSTLPESIFSMPASISPIFLKLDISWITSWKLAAPLIAPIVTFMLTDLFDSLGTLAGVGFRAGIFSKEDSKPIQRTLEADAVATVVGSALGLSTTTSFIESASGVEEGGRTGLTAVITGICFIFTLFLLPLFVSIPAVAIYPVLVVVGVFMFTELVKVNFENYEIGIPAFLIIVLMPLTFSITKGLAAGFITYTFIKIVKGKFKDLNLVLILMTIVSVLAFYLEAMHQAK